MLRRSWVTIAGAAAGLWMAVALCNAVLVRTGPPRLTPDRPFMSFGDAAPDTRIVHRFTIRNSGSSPLEIQSITTTCGCTSASVSSPKLRPGETGWVEVQFITPRTAGATQQHVDLATNDPQQPFHRLTINANVTVNLELQPRMMDLGVVERLSPPAARTLHIISGKGVGMSPRVLRAQSDNEHVVAEIRESGKGPEVVIALSPQTPIGPLSASIHVSDPADATTVAEARVIAQVRGKITSRPSEVILGPLGPGETATSRIEVAARRGTLARPVVEISPSLRSFVEADTSVSDGKVVVVLRANPARAPGPANGQTYRGFLRIDTDVQSGEPSRETLKLPVTISSGDGAGRT